MAWLLVQLKLRLLRNALRASTGAKAAFITSTIFAALVAAAVFIVLARLRGHPGAVDLTTVVFTLFAFGWLILPLIAFGLDATLDPATLALFPLRTRTLAVGLLAASATGAWPLATFLGLLGVTVGLARGRRPARRGARGAAGGAVLPHAGAVRHHGPGRAAALAPR